MKKTLTDEDIADWLELESQEFLIGITHELKEQVVSNKFFLKLISDDSEISNQPVAYCANQKTVKDVCEYIETNNDRLIDLLDVVWEYAKLKMENNESWLLEATTSSFQELLSYLISLTSACEILKDKTPPDINRNISIVREISENLKRDVQDIYPHVEKEFDLLSLSKTASQIRGLTSKWKKQVEPLSVAISQIKELRELGFRLEDSQLDAILGESLILAFVDLNHLLDVLEVINENDLISWRPSYK